MSNADTTNTPGVRATAAPWMHREDFQKLQAEWEAKLAGEGLEPLEKNGYMARNHLKDAVRYRAAAVRGQVELSRILEKYASVHRFRTLPERLAFVQYAFGFKPDHSDNPLSQGRQQGIRREAVKWAKETESV